jgi:hypothetical protein
MPLKFSEDYLNENKTEIISKLNNNKNIIKKASNSKLRKSKRLEGFLSNYVADELYLRRYYKIEK